MAKMRILPKTRVMKQRLRCKIINDPDMLVFDHLNPGDKRDLVSMMANSSWGLKSIQAEIAKRRVLCANHHQKHAIQQFGYKKWRTED